MASLPAVFVHGFASNGAIAAAVTQPKRAPVRRAPPRRRPPAKKPAPRRRPPAKKPAPRRPPVKLPSKIARVLVKKTPLGKVMDFAQLYVEGADYLLQKLGASPIRQKVSPPRADLPFVAAVPRGSPALKPFPELSPVTVRATRALSSPFGAPSYFGAPPTAPSPWEDIAKKGTGYKRNPRSKSPPLTRKKQPGVKSRPGKIEDIVFGPVPKEELDRDPCKPKKRDRNACPKSGFRRVCESWKKIPCGVINNVSNAR